MTTDEIEAACEAAWECAEKRRDSDISVAAIVAALQAAERVREKQATGK